MKNIIKILVIISIFSTLIYAQNDDKEILSGNLKYDSYALQQKFPENADLLPAKAEPIMTKKSPFLAGTLSLLLPGSGEFYTKSYWKTAIFLAIEAAAITTAIIYESKGDKQTESFEKFADENWSPEKYARWTLGNIRNFIPDITDAKLQEYNEKLFQDGKLQWNILNELEREVGSSKQGSWYSHTLPAKGRQQYYEMIGKYQQFNMGWNDATDSPENPYTYGKPLSPNYLYYSGERGEANDLYSVSSTFVKIVVANHFLSAIDAAWSASRYNKKLNVSMKMKEQFVAGKIDMYPQLNLRYNF